MSYFREDVPVLGRLDVSSGGGTTRSGVSMDGRAAAQRPVAICNAGEADMPAILAFAVSDHHWEDCTADSIFLVAKVGDTIVGYTFCKPLSPCWAMLDGMYVAPKYRKTGAGRLLYDELLCRLRARGIKYISTLIRADDATTQSITKRHGFTPQNTYVWYDKTLDA
jgi:GNAT superfamily N-acetyltransferase